MSMISQGPFSGGFEAPPDFGRHNHGVNAKFFVEREPILDEAGKPTFDVWQRPIESERELCTITIAGDGLTEITVPAVDSTPMSPHVRFAEQYASWKAGVDHLAGTPLGAWNQADMLPRLVDDLGRLNIVTVEGLAAVSDSHVVKMIDGRSWRARAIAWVAARPKAAEVSEIAELRAENEAFKLRFEALEKAGGANKPVHKSEGEGSVNA